MLYQNPCDRCGQPVEYGFSRYLTTPRVHVCQLCAIEWDIRIQMVALGFMQKAERPPTTPVDEAIGGTD